MFLIIKQKTQKVPLHVKFMLKISIGITLLCKIIWLSYIFQKKLLSWQSWIRDLRRLKSNRIVLYYFFLLVGLSNLFSKRSIVINKSHSLLLSVVSHRKRFIQEKNNSSLNFLPTSIQQKFFRTTFTLLYIHECLLKLLNKDILTSILQITSEQWRANYHTAEMYLTF